MSVNKQAAPQARHAALGRASQHAANNLGNWAGERDSFRPEELREALEQAVDEAAELEELGREEARWLAKFLWQDMQQAGQNLAAEGRELGDWLGFDLKLIEAELLKTLARSADDSVAQWQALGLQPQQPAL